MEPYEEAVVEVPETYVGSVVELFAQRKGEMVDMQPSVQVRAVWGGGLGAKHGGLGPKRICVCVWRVPLSGESIHL